MQMFAPFVQKKRRVFFRVLFLFLAVIFVTAFVSQNVFAKNTYVITDGDQVRLYTTYATNPAEVLDQAGVELEEGDTYVTQPGDGVSEITIHRSQMVTIYDQGEKIETVSYGETVQALLNRLGIAVSEDCFLSLPLDTQTYDGMAISIDRILEVQEVYTVDIHYETILCYDPGMAQGQQEVLVEGVTGQASRRANVVYVNTQEIGRTILEETVISQPVNKVLSVGTGTSTVSQGVTIGDGYIITETGEMLTYYRTEQFKTTAYTKTDEGCDDITATGTYARVGAVAVDPKVVPYGTRMFIVSNDGQYIYGIATAEDCGGAINGNHIDLYFDTTGECFQYGVRSATVYFLG